MPDHSTWFRFLSLYDSFAAWIYSMPYSDRTFVNGVEHYNVEHVFTAAFVILLLIFLALLVRGRFANVKESLVPDPKLSLRTFFELVSEAALGMMKDVMGPKHARYFLPLIGTCAFFILFSNLSGLFPGGSPPTSNWNTTVACAIVIFFTTHIYGFKEQGPKYILHFFGPVIPKKGTPIYAVPFILLLMALMFVIELISHAARPLSLSVRLMGNMFADHTVVGIFAVLVPIIPFVIPLPVMLLGVLVCVVQTLVFCLLSVIYIALAVEHAEEH